MTLRRRSVQKKLQGTTVSRFGRNGCRSALVGLRGLCQQLLDFVGVAELRIELQGGFELLASHGEIARLLIGHAQVIVIGRVLGVALDGLLQACRSPRCRRPGDSRPSQGCRPSWANPGGPADPPAQVRGPLSHRRHAQASGKRDCWRRQGNRSEFAGPSDRSLRLSASRRALHGEQQAKCKGEHRGDSHPIARW